VLPGIGLVLVAGPLAGALVAELERAVVTEAGITDGSSVLGAALFSQGIPRTASSITKLNDYEAAE